MEGEGGREIPVTAYRVRLRPKGVQFFRLQEYKRARISQVEVYVLRIFP